jgi:hypothetical protein
VTDNVGNVSTYTVASDVKADRTLPLGTISAVPAGPVNGNSVTLSGTSSDGMSGVQKVDVTFTAPGTGNICLNPPTPLTWSCSWNTLLVPDGVYTLQLVVTDVAGNVSAPITRPIIVDNTPPAMNLISLTETVNPQYQHSAGSTMWFNPAFAGTTLVTVEATDGNGIVSVDFPDMGPGWSPAGGSDTIGSPYYDFSYNWAAAALAPGAKAVTALDGGGNTGSLGLTINADSTSPSGGSINYTDGFTTSTSIVISSVAGLDVGGSGVSRTVLQRRSALLGGGTCGAFGAWSDLATNPPASYTDSTILDANCYEYQLVTYDNVENAGEPSQR